jgi:fused signal recognition particle receptor
MGLFSKIKSIFGKKEEQAKELSEEEKLEVYEDTTEEEPEEIEEVEETEVEEPEVEEESVQEEPVVEEVKEEPKKEKKSIFKKKEKISKEEKKEIVETEKYVEGLSKSRDNFVNKLSVLGIKYTKVSDDFYDELEEILITADIGVNTVMDFVDRLKKRVKEEKIEDFEYLKEVIVDELFMIYVGDEVLASKLQLKPNETNVILFVGVNGVGKTTSIAKIAYNLKNEGKKVMLIAGDTFRAGAVSQLEEWAKRVGVSFFGDDRTDPSAVIYDGLTKAKEEKYDVVLVDTAGRLQNKSNLMKELEKMNRVIGEITPGNPVETLLVIDATTGQNGISQAKSFKEITNITGIVLTKLDGTAKGGIVLAIKELVGIPVKYVGLGEKETDLIPFDIEKYIYGLFKEF